MQIDVHLFMFCFSFSFLRYILELNNSPSNYLIINNYYMCFHIFKNKLHRLIKIL